MKQAGVRAALAGCDISGGMLAEAMRCWPFGLPPPELRRRRFPTLTSIWR
jgi:hypothetical protein